MFRARSQEPAAWSLLHGQDMLPALEPRPVVARATERLPRASLRAFLLSAAQPVVRTARRRSTLPTATVRAAALTCRRRSAPAVELARAANAHVQWPRPCSATARASIRSAI